LKSRAGMERGLPNERSFPENQGPEPAAPGSLVSGCIPRERAMAVVIDGLGGNLGAAIVKELRDSFGDAVKIWAGYKYEGGGSAPQMDRGR